jgi:vanillate O-demethylase ferredoxin subunit
MSMIWAVRAQNQAFHLYYCSRSAERTAFLDELRPLIDQGGVTIHHDGGDPARSLDLISVLREQQPGTHFYYCGPSGMLNAAEAASSHWADGTRHCERFSADPAAAHVLDESDKPFEIALAKTGKTLIVPVGKSIVQVLKANGIIVDTSCEEGFCGTCMTRYLDGEPLHRDSVLDEEDREEFMMVCCSRAKSARITLDL